MSDPEKTGARIEALRAGGAARFDPVGFRCIEAFARRAAAERGEAGRFMEARLAALLDEFGGRFEQGRKAADDTLARAATQFPHAADDLQGIGRSGTFAELRRLIGRLEAQSAGRPLAGLLAHVGLRSQESPDGGLANGAGENVRATVRNPAAPKELAYFRNTWSKLNAERQLTQALSQAPENAGPLNSHLLVLQSLKAMRETSPDYLRRFMSYVDALLWLDRVEVGGKTTQKNITRSEREKIRKSGRSNSG